jgi:hypothetical protein
MATQGEQGLRPVAIGGGAISLTARQLECLAYVAAHPDATYVQITRALGLTAKSSAHRLLTGLEERGWIRRRHCHSGRIETLRPVPAVRPWTAAEGLAFARAWRIRMKPHFDALYGPEPTGRRAA